MTTTHTTADGLSDDDIRAILTTVQNIGVVGASANSERPVHRVMNWMIETGYTVSPINPGLAGQTILDLGVAANIASLTAPVDMIDIFRNADAAHGVVMDAIAHAPELGIRVVWMQFGIVNVAAAEAARAAGLTVVMDRCPKKESARLGVSRLGVSR